MRALVVASLAMAAPCASAIAQPSRLVWPLPYCAPSDIAVASPAPPVKDSSSLKEIPFDVWLWPPTAAFIVALDENGAARPQCLIAGSTDWEIARPAMLAVAGLTFATPRTPNRAAPGGRYLVRISSNLGSAWVDPPPPDPLLPDCHPGVGESWLPGWTAPLPAKAPKPATRVPPNYPDRALREEMQGSVSVVLDIFSNGAASPVCIGRTTPPGWFESAAVRAVSQWTFNPRDGMGRYTVMVRFKLE